ncbi:hypothetical protein HK097_003239 [Rhizophlyctis rosea]|uniref:Chitin-binding type-4 domain-containing protein n=1 Tax=Rhizophlyctis rosea TaxID=64517 RepID=A0AAD5S2P0_9FUNG|nr:hypothetical protein HK097_003239 [Rhizophlyctis rosea]
MFFNALHLATAALLLTHTTIAHINIASPPPRQHKNNPFTIGEPDYNMLEPLYGGVSVRPYPCRGYSKSQSVVSTAPGATINIDLEGSATHEFGHCQFAISYDDETFVVLKTVKDTCLDGSSVIGPNLRRYSLTLPSDLPECTNGCTLAWTWINNVGNREYYMNCVDIKTVGGPKSGTVSGKQLFVAHVPGYPTIPEPSVGSVTDCWLNARPSISLQISNGVLQSVSGGSRGVFPAPSTSASNTCPGTTTGGVIPSIPSSGTACGGGVELGIALPVLPRPSAELITPQRQPLLRELQPESLPPGPLPQPAVAPQSLPSQMQHLLQQLAPLQFAILPTKA